MSSPRRRRALVASTALIAIALSAASTLPAAARRATPAALLGEARTPAFQYAVTPTSDPALWATLETVDQRVAALRIPPGRLARMSTLDVLDAVLDYPLLGDFQGFDTPQEGLAVVRASSSALQEFLGRPDAAEVAVHAYAALDLVRVAENEPLPTIKLAFLELLLAQPEILEPLGSQGRGNLVASVVRQWAAKDGFPEPVYGEDFSALAVMRSLSTDSPEFADAVQQDDEVREFLRTGLVAHLAAAPTSRAREVFDTALVDTYGEVTAIPALPGESGGTGRFAPSTLAFDVPTSVTTPAGTRVSAIAQTWELTATQRANNNTYIAQGYPKALMVRGSTRMYNCHSYAWHRQDTGNTIWLNVPSAYMSDGSYRLVANTGFGSTVSSAAPVGAKVYYVQGDHSAIKYSSTQVISKWGAYGLMRHAPNYGLYTATRLYYYTR